MAVTLNDKYLKGVVNADELKGMEPMVKVAHEMIENKSGLGNDFLGWVDLPVNYDKEEFERIKKAAAKIKSDSEVLIVIGIGGSYLGARAAIELLRSTLYNSLAKDTPKIFFAGNSISPTYLNEVIELVKDKDFSVNIISKSGTTTEPALAFRVFREMLEEKYGKDGAKGRIYATTDKAKGTLKELADAEGYETFVVPDDVGGRYSVLTAVGLLPIACAGIDINKLMQGAQDALQSCDFTDLDGDGSSELTAIFRFPDGTNASLVWFYTDGSFVYNPEFSILPGEPSAAGESSEHTLDEAAALRLQWRKTKKGETPCRRN